MSSEWEIDYFFSLRRTPVAAYLLVADSGFVFIFISFDGSRIFKSTSPIMTSH